MKYSNPTWEPYFKDIAPILSKLYFMTNSGTIKYIVATMIFKKMSFLEVPYHWSFKNKPPAVPVRNEKEAQRTCCWIIGNREGI